MLKSIYKHVKKGLHNKRDERVKYYLQVHFFMSNSIFSLSLELLTRLKVASQLLSFIGHFCMLWGKLAVSMEKHYVFANLRLGSC